jgi:asparagine synthetase B (glutamine-hydrolysing)
MERSFVEAAFSIPGDMKMHYGPGGRKWILRELGRSMDLPSKIVSRPKKATQYSSGSARVLEDACRKNIIDANGMTRREMHRVVQSVLDRISLELGLPHSMHSQSTSPKFDMEPTNRLLELLALPSRPQ